MPVLGKIVEVDRGKVKRLAVDRDLPYFVGKAKLFNPNGENIDMLDITAITPRTTFSKRTHDILNSKWLTVERFPKKTGAGWQLLQ